MAKRTTKRTSKKKYTLSEFKAWLEGIEELQPDDWAPDAAQWKTIRDKLMNIVEEQPPQPQNNEPVQQPQPQMPPQQLPPSGLAPPPINRPTAMPPVDPVTPELTPAAKAALTGKLPSEMVPSADGKVKTPNIDTTDGNYGSSFE